MTKKEMSKTKTTAFGGKNSFVLNFKFLDFEFVSNFVLRIYYDIIDYTFWQFKEKENDVSLGISHMSLEI